jgi:hypothetical protein
VIGHVALVVLGLYTMNTNIINPKYCVDCDGLAKTECRNCHKPICLRCAEESAGLCLECLIQEENNEPRNNQR